MPKHATTRALVDLISEADRRYFERIAREGVR
jgi:hypothetical protein